MNCLKLVALCISLCICHVNAQAQNPPSLLRIKMMQTRTFERGQSDVVLGIQEYMTNIGFECRLNGLFAPGYTMVNPVMVPPDMSSKYDFLQGSTGVFECKRSPKIYKPNSEEIVKYELSVPSIPYDGIPVPYLGSVWSKQSKKTTVRVRYFQESGKSQSFNEALYADHFKNLADALFVNAIELTPQEMQ